MSETVEGEVVESSVVEVRPATMVRAAPGDVTEAFEEYRKIQTALDRSMPDCLMEIQGRAFRKKNYWRAIATAFNLSVDPLHEAREEHGDDWGYVVSYRAVAPNGRTATGDGACFASEKRGPQATVHNVRSHAHTRAYNRAVSNLVGFGEVSAEEMGGESRQPAQRQSPPASVSGRKITEKMQKRLFAITMATAERLGRDQESFKAFAKSIMANMGFESSSDLTREPYDKLCDLLENLTFEQYQKIDAGDESPF